MKKQNIRNGKIFSLVKVLGCILLFSGVLSGCGQKESISLEEVPAETRAAEASDDEEKEQEAVKEVPAKNEAEMKPEVVSVYVCGAVNAPGVYELPAGSRLYQAVEAAGGMREDADRNYLNLAMELIDGEKLQVPTKEEVQAGLAVDTSAGSGQTVGEEQSGSQAGAAAGRLVNINTADAELLMTLPGIGEAKAKSIIDYRTDKGPFGKIEDIMNITGIKQSVYEKIKDAICVK